MIWSSAAEIAARVRARAVSAREVIDAHLARIAEVDGKVGAFLHVDADGARAQADAIDRGEVDGPLAGVPIALKDMLVTAGMPTTAASKMLAGWIPPYDGTAVARLRAAGAVIVGKTSCDEFAMGSSNERAATGPVRNPWDLERVPGGSSGGSAAAVAAAMTPVALGTDTGGSIRQPAAFSGVVGLKPTYGRVSRYGVIAFASSLDQVGPFGRTVEDAAIVTEVIAGHDPRDATTVAAPAPDLRASLEASVRGLRVGIAKEYAASDPEIAASVARALDVLRDAGASAHEISLPHTKYALPVYYIVAPAEASSNLARYDGVRFGLREPRKNLLDLYRASRGAGFGPEVKRRIMLGTFALRSGYYDAYYRKAQQVRALIKRDFDRAFEGVDVILSPTTPTPAFRIGEKATPVDMYLGDIFTLSCNLAGLPGISVPGGFSSGGLPIGVQLLARPLDETTLVRAARAIERAHDVRRPSL